MHNNNDLNSTYQGIIENVQKHDCSVVGVGVEEGSPAFAYSVGIQRSLGKPELIVVGLRTEVSHSIINQYCRRIKEGESFMPEGYYQDFIQGFDVMLQKVDKSNYDDYLGFAQWFYHGDDFSTLQLVYPDTNGLWPWDPGASMALQYLEPNLAEPEYPPIEGIEGSGFN